MNNLGTSHLGSWDPFSEAQTDTLFQLERLENWLKPNEHIINLKNKVIFKWFNETK